MTEYLGYQGAQPPYVSTALDKKSSVRDRVAAGLHATLEEGERMLLLVPVIKVFPSLNVLVITDQRVLAGWRDGELLLREEWDLSLAVADVDRVEITGFMDNVKFVRTDGEGVKVGNLPRTEDGPALVEALETAKTGRGPTPPAPTYEPYLPPEEPR